MRLIITLSSIMVSIISSSTQRRTLRLKRTISQLKLKVEKRVKALFSLVTAPVSTCTTQASLKTIVKTLLKLEIAHL